MRLTHWYCISVIYYCLVSVCVCVSIFANVCVAEVQRNSSLTANMSRVYPSSSSSLALYSSFLTESLILHLLWSLGRSHLKSFGKGFRYNVPFSDLRRTGAATVSWCREEEREIQEGNYRWAERKRETRCQITQKTTVRHSWQEAGV